MAPRQKKKSSLYDVINASLPANGAPDDADKGTYLDMPFLNFGYNFYGLLTVDYTQYNRLNALKVSREHIPHQGIVLHHHIVNRMKFLNWRDTPENFAIAEKELELHRQLINRSICSWLKSFILYVANEVGMKIGNNRIQTWNDFMYWVENCLHTREDAIMVMKTLYTSFQYVPEHKRHLCICVSYTYNISMLEPDGVGIQKNFIEKMITFRINQFRLQVNNACAIYNGYIFRIIRPRGKASANLPECVPKYLHDWMITHEEPTDEKKESIKQKRLSKANSNRRNSCTYKKKQVQTEEDVILEIENIDAIRASYVKKLNLLKKNKNKKHDLNEGMYDRFF